MSAAGTQDVDQPTRRSDVSLRLPADSAYVAVLRTAAAGLAARQDFTIDDIGDLRMAVSEAFALVLPTADPGSDLVADFYLSPYELTVRVAADATSPVAPDRDSWAWQVIAALTVRADLVVDDGIVAVSFTLHSGTDL